MEIKVVYSKRRTISISIEKCVVVVKAPIGTKKRTIEDMLDKHSHWIEKHLLKQRIKLDLMDSLTCDDIKELKKAAKVYLKDRTEYFSKIMGLQYGRITITSAEKRFGSCSSKGNISYSYRLMLYPEEAREYVVVHELAHLKEMNHSKRFYSIVESVLPDYKARRRILKNYI